MPATSIASGPIGFVLHRAHSSEIKDILGNRHELNALSVAVARRFDGIRINPEAMRQILSIPGDVEKNIIHYGPVALILSLAPHDRHELGIFLGNRSRLTEVSTIVATQFNGADICPYAVRLIVMEFRHVSPQDLQDAGSVGFGALLDGKTGKARKPRKPKPRGANGRKKPPACKRRSVRKNFCH